MPMVEWLRNVILRRGNIVVGVRLGNSDLGTTAYNEVAGGLDLAGQLQILKEWQGGKDVGQLGEFTWREERNQD
jgi:hypothetical protein